MWKDMGGSGCKALAFKKKKELRRKGILSRGKKDQVRAMVNLE